MNSEIESLRQELAGERMLRAEVEGRCDRFARELDEARR